jgi:uncharacterized repeat protein (TIGR03803 family)
MRLITRHLIQTALTTATVLGPLCAAGPSYATTFTLLGTLNPGSSIGAVNGSTLYGTDSGGDLFSMTTSGVVKVLHTFTGGNDGGPANQQLVLNSAGALFGTSHDGGAYGGGTLWKFAHGTLTTMHAFGNGSDGSGPLQGPASDGPTTLAGTTSGGADNTNGNAFTMRGTKYKVRYDFMSNGDGHCPFSGVAADAKHNLYGTTVGNGFGGNPTGSVWQLTPANKLNTLYVFQDGTDGEYPDQAPALDSAGNIYGTTYIKGGSNFAGAIYKITGTQGTVLHSFDSNDGYQPNSPLVLNTDGKFYGTTYQGGPYGFGVVYSISTTGAFTMVYAFTGKSDGSNPTGNLVHDSSGTIYGGTQTGTIFKIVP